MSSERETDYARAQIKREIEARFEAAEREIEDLRDGVILPRERYRVDPWWEWPPEEDRRRPTTGPDDEAPTGA